MESKKNSKLKQFFNNLKSTKKSLILIITALIMIVAGVSYALSTWTFRGENNTIETGDLSISFLEGNDVININDALPMNDENGKSQLETFDFAITTETSKDISMAYDIVLEKLNVALGYIALEDSDMRIYLTDYDDNVVLGPIGIDEIATDDYVLVSNVHAHSTNTTKVKSKYKLRAWIDKDKVASDWNSNTKLQYKFKIGIRANDARQYQVIFNSNYGTPTTYTQDIAFNKATRLKKTTFTREGYLFKGWSETTNGTATYQDFEKVTNILPSNNLSITLYAIWAETQPYTVVYNANGGEGSMSNSTYTNLEQKALSANAFTKTNYRFAGWATTPEGRAVYQNEQVVSKLLETDQIGQEVNLYAVWTKIPPYYIIYNANGGTGHMSRTTYEYEEAKSLDHNEFVKPGYEYIGWSTTPEGTVTYQNEESVSRLTDTGEELTLYAVWRKKHLNEYTWTEINEISESGQAEAYFGECFDAIKNDLAADGQITQANLIHTKEFAYGDNTLHAMIAGFNHDVNEEGNRVGITFLTYESVGTSKFNNDNTNIGGWEDSLLRENLNTDYLNFPEEMQSAIKVLRKPSYKSDATSKIINVEDSLWIPSVTELYGAWGYENNTEESIYYNNLDYGIIRNYKGEGTQYELFQNNVPDGIDNSENALSFGHSWWTRSPALNHNGFNYINANGGLE